MIKLTIENALNASQALPQFGQKPLAFQMSLTVANNQRVLNDVGKEYEKRRLALVEEMGIKDEATGHINIAPGNQKKFQDAITAIVQEEVKLDLKQIKKEKLPADFEIEPNTLVFLEWLFI